MADGIKISALTEATDAQTVDGNLLETAVVDSSSSTGFSSKKTPISRLAKYVLDKYSGLSLGGSARTVKTAIDALKTATDALDTEMDTKADTNGTYDDLVAGTSKQLLSDSYTEDFTPYKYRKSPYTDRMSESIVGASVVWNQLIDINRLPSDSALYSATTYTANGVTFTKNNDGSISVVTDANGATANTSVKIGSNYSLPTLQKNTHITRCIGGSATTVRINYASSRNVTSENIFGGVNGGFNMWLRVDSGSTFTTPVKIYPQVFDLTAMFGTTVADAIYAMGADGVALFRSWYPNDYYAYSAPTMEHVSGLEAHEMVGFNQWDEEITNGYFDNSGGWINASTVISSKNPIKVLPNTTYYLAETDGSDAVYIEEFTEEVPSGASATNKFIVRYESNNRIFITHEHCHAIHINFGMAYGNVYKNDICINLSDPLRNGQYKPYSKHSYTLDASLTLRGVLKYDSSKGIYADGDVYKADGTVDRRYGIVDLGTLNWIYRPTGYNAKPFVAHLENAKLPPASNVIVDALITNKYVQKPPSTMNSATLTDAFAIGFYFQGNTELNVVDTAYTDAESFKAAMSGVYLVYELATPTTEEAEPFDAIQITDGTEEYVTDCLAPVGHESKYYQNLRSKIEGLPTDFSAIICATEATNKASKNYAVGDYLIYNNTLYKVTTAIATDATLTVGTNITATTIMAEIKALQ